MRATSGNRLLDAVLKAGPALRAAGSSLALPVGTRVLEVGQPVEAAYFPLSGVLSVMIETAAGQSAEALTVGNEGMIGIGVWLGAVRSLETIVQQAPGGVVAIPAPALRRLQSHRRLRRLMDQFTAYSLRLAYQSAICNAHHSVEQRTCRWILTSADRARSNTVAMTQALLAAMLGVRRQSVGEIAVQLQREGLFEYRRSQIRIARRGVLERRTCVCYQLLRRCYAQLIEPYLD